MRKLAMTSALLLLAACNPNAGEIESGLVSRGFGVGESACMARELAGRLDERDWRMIAEVAGDTMRTEDEWRDMTIGEIGNKLNRLGDTRLMSTLLRAGMGCALLGEPRSALRSSGHVAGKVGEALPPAARRRAGAHGPAHHEFVSTAASFHR